jgi:predicted RecB family nuclease
MSQHRRLDDDLLKLVRYTIVSLRHDKERILQQGRSEILVSKRMTDESFNLWILAQYPGRIPADERQSLRVSYEVLERWEKPARFAEE